MTLIQSEHPNRIALHAGKQGTHFAETGAQFSKNQQQSPNPTYLDTKTLLKYRHLTLGS